MKVLLVQSYLVGKEPPVFPIGLCCLAANLQGYHFKTFDPNVSGDAFGEFADILDAYRPEVIGISLRNIDSTNKRKVVFYYSYLKEMVNAVRNSPCRESRIIVGGSGFSMFAREIMEDEPEIDYGVFLEGEETFPELLQNLDCPDSVEGVFFRSNGKVVFTGPRAQLDLSKTKPPKREAVPIEPYKGISEAIGVETKRGCVFACIYCIYGFLNGKTLRLKDPVKVADEIESLVSGKKVRRFTFVDSVFNQPLEHAEAVCREIIRRKIDVSWSAWFHEEYLTEEFAGLCREAGCDKFILSPDGFSDRVLQNLGKTMKKRDIIRAFEILVGIEDTEICFNFFKNPPGQDMLTFLSLMRFYLGAKLRLGSRVHFEFNSMRIEPHTRLYRIALEQGLIREEDNLLYPKYFTNRNTRCIERIFDTMLLLKGK
ncbi:MAG: radical SAM protein [Nitrospirota bacterium]